MALERNPAAGKAMLAAGWEVASHGYRWIDYQTVPEEVERAHIAKTVRVHQEVLGERPRGLYQGKPNARTRRLCVEEGGFLYDSDSYADDLPYWDTNYGSGGGGGGGGGEEATTHHHPSPHLVIPYTLDVNDMRWSQGNEGDHFYTYCKDAFDQLYEEGGGGGSGGGGIPKMMTVGLHGRIAGRPGRARALARFLDYVKDRPGVWICTREQIAKHWIEHHPPTCTRSAKL